MVDPRAGRLLPGLSCFLWTWLLVGSFCLGFLFVVPILILGFVSLGNPGVLPAFHALLWWWLGVIVVAPSITAIGKVTKEQREVIAGYTTLPRSYLNVDYRNWKTGEVIPKSSSAEAVSGRRTNPPARAPFTDPHHDGQEQSALSKVKAKDTNRFPRWLWGPVLFAAGLIALRVFAEIARYNSRPASYGGQFNNLDESLVVIAAFGILAAVLLWWAGRRISSKFSVWTTVQPTDAHYRGIFRAETVGALRLTVSSDVGDKAAKLGNPFGIIANGQGISFWRVGRHPEQVFILDWQQIDAIELGEVTTPARTFPSILIRMTGGPRSSGVPVWLSSERRHGLFPQSESEVQAVIDNLGRFTRRIDS